MIYRGQTHQYKVAISVTNGRRQTSREQWHIINTCRAARQLRGTLLHLTKNHEHTHRTKLQKNNLVVIRVSEIC